MSKKENILEAWIMVEHLSEGDLKSTQTKDVAQIDGKFYSQLKNVIDLGLEKEGTPPANWGAVVYFDIFDFGGVIKQLREQFNLSESYDEIKVGKKFSLALYFNKELQPLSDMLFFTMSAYIRYTGKLPKEEELNKAESSLKEKFREFFEDSGNDPEKFDSAMSRFFDEFNEMFKQTPQNFRIEFLKNVESDATNMHSFFIRDLEKAKTVNTVNLEAYLFGGDISKRVNLDGKKDSERFNPKVFTDILQPKYYPPGRFPSNTKYSLYFMQQVAVILSWGLDPTTIRSVNGPPGTGKTTLLKDIFAELVVESAYYASNPSKRSSAAKIKYSEDKVIYALSTELADRNIVVASSNNGAVQNIVNELPLADGIDEDLREELKEADYFFELANSSDKSENTDEEAAELPIQENWGLFSLEGGRAANIKKIVSAVEGICKHLENKYTPQAGVYNEFNKQLAHVTELRDDAQKLAVQYMAGVKSASEQLKGTPLDMDCDYDTLQKSNPWFDESFRIAQSKLFISALKVRKQFLYENLESLKSAVNIFANIRKFADERAAAAAAWGWINYAIPVISSTFASFGRMYECLDANTLGHLFIDEAGQALPQASVGAVFRSRHVMVVGDPSQIKPVLTLDSAVLRMLGEHYNVTEKYLSDSASTQTLVDAASRYGFYRKNGSAWIGIPLWVHGRCRYPMFEIANEISYDGMMVHGRPEYGKSDWFDVKGSALDKYVKEQGDILVKMILELSVSDPEILDSSKKDKVYVITPFANVANTLAKKLKSIGFTRYKGGKATNVGTIHTFQGKEAPIVFMVLGADRNSLGAAAWAVSEPNMMNVAATRAKQEFYIIGDKALYSSLKNDVVNVTARIIDEYKKAHPELAAPLAELLPKPALNEQGRVTGRVKVVINGQKARYAYVSGDDKVEYYISEKEYMKVENAAEVIQKGKRVSFEPRNGNKGKWSAENIKPC